MDLSGLRYYEQEPDKSGLVWFLRRTVGYTANCKYQLHNMLTSKNQVNPYVSYFQAILENQKFINSIELYSTI